jgi:hypothetical protein
MSLLRLVQAYLVTAYQRFVEVENVLEVATVVVVRLAHEVGFNEVEDDFAEVAGALDAPQLEDGAGHQAELAQRQFADALDQFAAGDVVLRADLARLLAARQPAEPLLGMAQRGSRRTISARTA